MSEKDTKGIIVLGAGGHGKSVVSILLADGLKVLGVMDDDPESWDLTIVGVPVLGPLKLLDDYPNNPVIIGLGDNKQRKTIAQRFPKVKWMNFSSSSAYINPTAQIGEGTVILTFAIIGADVKIGDHAIISAHTTVGHDTHIGHFAHITPGVQIAGGAHIGEEAMLGLGSIVCPEVKIGAGSTLAAGAVAVKDIEAGSIVYGAPAKSKT